MTVPAGHLNALAIACLTEIVLGDCDHAVLDALADEVPDDQAEGFLNLLSTYAWQIRRYGPEVLRRQGLHAAVTRCQGGAPD